MTELGSGEKIWALGSCPSEPCFRLSAYHHGQVSYFWHLSFRLYWLFEYTVETWFASLLSLLDLQQSGMMQRLWQYVPLLCMLKDKEHLFQQNMYCIYFESTCRSTHMNRFLLNCYMLFEHYRINPALKRSCNFLLVRLDNDSLFYQTLTLKQLYMKQHTVFIHLRNSITFSEIKLQNTNYWTICSWKCVNSLFY